MGFRHRSCSNGGLCSSVIIILLVELLVWRSPSFSLSAAFFCHGRKVPSSLSSSSTSWKPAVTTPSLLGTRFNPNRITANRSSKHPTAPYVGHYIPFSTTSDSSRSSLFAKNRQIETDDGADDEGVEDGEEDEKRIGYNNNDKRKGALPFLGNVQYGVNCVHKDFLRLSWKVYSRTFLGMAPFVVLLFLILPACSSSSSPSLRLLATKVQGFLQWTFEILAEGSRVFFGSPMYALENWIGSWWTSGSTTPLRSAWKSRNNVLLRALLWGPIVEELIFRLAFRSVWKILFRPISIGSSSRSRSGGKDRNYGEPDKTSTAKPGKSLLVAPSTFLVKILLDRRPPRQIQKPKLRYTNRSWTIASGICFAIAHFSNHFPILLDKYDFDGEIRLPSGTMQERFLLGCFPGDFASRPENKEFCLVSMILAGTVYQAMHCFISTLVLYGPLLDSSKSRRGGILAAIGAHIAWNANVIFLTTNLKLRLLWKVGFLALFSATKTKVTRPVHRGELF